MSSSRKLFFSILTLIFFLVLLEGASRIILWKKYGSIWVQEYYDIFSYADGMRFRQSPNANLYYSDQYGNAKVQSLLTDKNSFVITGNDPSRIVKKEKQVDIRVILTGGSTLTGYGATTNGETIASQLEILLQDHFKNKTVEVINAGVGAYGVRQELTYYLLYLSEYKPDLVVSFNGVNDYLESHFPSDPFDRHDWVDWLSQWHATLQASTIQYLFDRRRNTLQGLLDSLITPNNIWRTPEVFYRMMNSFLNKNQGSKKGNDTGKKKSDTDDDFLEKVLNSDYWRDIRRYESLCRHDGVPYLAVLQPHLGHRKPVSEEEARISKSYRDHYDRWMTALSQTSEKINETAFKPSPTSGFLNLTGAFDGIKETLYVDTCHYNDKAQKRLAENLFPRVVQMIKKD